MDTGSAGIPGAPAAPAPFRCSSCGSGGLEPGFVEDAGQNSLGYARWVAGALERGIFGGARLRGKKRWQIEAFRCPACGHLDLYARHQD